MNDLRVRELERLDERELRVLLDRRPWLDADVLATAMTRLSNDHRSVLRLRYWDGLTFPEIGERLGRSPDAVRKLWYRAVERLQEEMNDESNREGNDCGSSDVDRNEPASV